MAALLQLLTKSMWQQDGASLYQDVFVLFFSFNKYNQVYFQIDRFVEIVQSYRFRYLQNSSLFSFKGLTKANFFLSKIVKELKLSLTTAIKCVTVAIFELEYR